MKKLIIQYGFIFFIACVLRLIYLDRIPIGIVHDNVNFILNAKAIWLSGHDISGTWNPLLLRPVPGEPAQTELLYTILAPFVGPFPLSLFSSHLPFALASALLCVILANMASLLYSRAAIIPVGLLAAINPWSVFFGRTAYEAPMAILFYFTSYILLFQKNINIKYLSILPLFAGFYTYMGYKILFIPYIIIISISAYVSDKIKKIPVYMVLCALCILMMGSFLAVFKSQSTGNRSGEIGIADKQSISRLVNDDRRLSISNPFSKYFVNKLTITAKILGEKYLGAFSPTYLFSQNDVSFIRFRLWNHGYFYYLDALFMIIGCFVLIRNKIRSFIFLLSILIISPLPSVLSTLGSSYSQRAGFIHPILIVIAGIGITGFIHFIRNLLIRKLTVIIIILLYTTSAMLFMHTLLFIQPIAMSEGSAFSSRLLSRYIREAVADGKHIIIVNPSPKTQWKAFLFYNDLYTSGFVKEARKMISQERYIYKSAKFLDCHEISALEKNTIYIFDTYSQAACKPIGELRNTVTIPQLSDGGTVMSIAGDAICQKYHLGVYPRDISMDDLRIETISRQQFCEHFITDFSKMSE